MYDVFLLICGNPTILIIFFLEFHVASRYIGFIISDKRCIFTLFKIYLSLFNCSGINLIFFCSLFIKLYLLLFRHICCGTFLGCFVLFCVYSNFETCFVCCSVANIIANNIWTKWINAPGSIHSSKLILFSYHEIAVQDTLHLL